MLNLKKLLTKILQYTPLYGQKTYTGSYTINSSGYVQLGSLSSVGTVYSATVSTWSSNTGVFSLVLSGNTAYLVGNAGTVIVNPSVKYLYYV